MSALLLAIQLAFAQNAPPPPPRKGATHRAAT
jgi:hypothetical protein